MPVAAAQHTASRRVLDSAAALFVAQGYEGTTLRQIAAGTGIKAGSIYHHFDSKEAIFLAVLHDGISVMLDAFDLTAAEFVESDSTDTRLLAHVRAHLGAVFENGPYTTAHVTSFFTAPDDVRKQVVPQRDLYEQRWNNLLVALFPAADPARLRLHRLILFGAMNATAEWFDPGGNLSIDDLASTISGQFLRGVVGMTP